MPKIKRVLFFTTYPILAAAPRSRVYSYLPLLEDRGIDTHVLNIIPRWIYPLTLKRNFAYKLIFYLYLYIARLFKILHVILLSPYYDVIYIRGVYFPLGLEKLLERINRRIVFDVVDAVYLRKTSTTGFFDMLKTKVYDQSLLLPKMLSVSQASNLISPYLENYIHQYCERTWVTVGPVQLHEPKPKSYSPTKTHNLTIGWMGSPSTAKYLYENNLMEVFVDLQCKYNVDIKIIGASKSMPFPDKLRVILEDWDLSRETEQLYSFDIGIMPLADTEWEKYKGGYKLLQYMSVGVPAVASPIGINRDLIQDGVNGFWAANREEWLEKLSMLIEDIDLRERIGKQGWETVKQHYTVEAQFPKLMAVLEAAMQGQE